MPTTPNYGWDTPADTDYVTNGALSIRTMANDADATVKANQDSANAAIATKFDIAGGSFTGPIAVPQNTAQGFAIAIAQDSGNNAVLRFLALDGSTIRGSLNQVSTNEISLKLNSNGNALTMDNVGDTTRTHNGETRPFAFAMEVGKVTVPANSTVSVSLNSGRFTQAPLVFVTGQSSTTNPVTGHVDAITTSGFTLYNTTANNRNFQWQAIQMTSSSAEG